MSEGLKLTILSPERRLAENIPVDEFTLPGSEGQIQILPGHAAMIGTIQPGLFNFHPAGKNPVWGVFSSGFFEVKNGEIQIMAETLELQGEIDLKRAKKAQLLAEEVLKEAELDEYRFRKYQLKLQRSIIRQSLSSGR